MHVGPFLIRRVTFVIWPVMGIIVYICDICVRPHYYVGLFELLGTRQSLGAG